MAACGSLPSWLYHARPVAGDSSYFGRRQARWRDRVAGILAVVGILTGSTTSPRARTTRGTDSQGQYTLSDQTQKSSGASRAAEGLVFEQKPGCAFRPHTEYGYSRAGHVEYIDPTEPAGAPVKIEQYGTVSLRVSGATER